MKLHSLTNAPGARTSRKRVGRGESSGSGKTSGKGGKGQTARKGHKHKLGFEGGQMRLVRRVPKRGFTNPSVKVFAPVNVGDLARFDSGAEITLATLRAAGIVKGRVDGVKILGDGAVEKKLSVKAQGFSASARAKLEAAGGTCEVVKD